MAEDGGINTRSIKSLEGMIERCHASKLHLTATDGAGQTRLCDPADGADHELPAQRET